MRHLRLLAPVLALLVLAGCTAPAPSAAPSAAPETAATLPPLDWEPDLELTRTFDGTSCRILLHVSDNAAEADLVAAAREFLAAGDWTTVEVSLATMSDVELEASRAQGRSDAELLASLLQDRIRADLTVAGLTGTWFSSEGRTTCS